MLNTYIKLSIAIFLIYTSAKLDAQCSIGADTISLGIEGGRVLLNNRGNLGSTTGFQISISPEDLRIQDFLGGIWLSGRTFDGNIRVNAAQYEGLFSNQGGAFWPGPYTSNLNNNLANGEVCSDWDLIFKVSKVEITQFIDEFNSNGLTIDNIPTNIKGWPANGNPHFVNIYGFDYPEGNLAPFEDVNLDGIYNPLDGDYPQINGATFAYFWILNTTGNNSFNYTNSSDNLNVDFYVMASTFDSGDEVVDNSIVFDITMENRNEETLDSLFFSYWIDAGGFCKQDYIGSMPNENYTFMYQGGELESNLCNSDNFQPSLIGVKLLNGVLSPRVFNNNELIYPALGEAADTLIEQKLSSFKHFIRSSPTTESFETDPINAFQYYNLQRGLWRDGREQLVNGVPNNFAFPGNPAAPEPGDFPMCNADLPEADIRTLTSCGPFRLQAGERQTITYALSRIFTEDVECVDVDVLTKGYDDLDFLLRRANLTRATKMINQNELSVYPNPVGDILHFQLEDPSERVAGLEIYNTNGQLIQQNKNLNNSDYHLNTSQIVSGMYFYRLQTDQGGIYMGKFFKG